ncbi:hypothetical protein K0M31_015119 [Melipona bicolor]|uniref:Uncharacterized protein n=1 Tax=Melipona bicolor TaxID=60889 RepID=A0AA40KFQ7_9HYME|nr:hypothetical protein K0M31_015119 [Melipona bicolor]
MKKRIFHVKQNSGLQSYLPVEGISRGRMVRNDRERYIAGARADSSRRLPVNQGVSKLFSERVE